jgi:hypothetical protein
VALTPIGFTGTVCGSAASFNFPFEVERPRDGIDRTATRAAAVAAAVFIFIPIIWIISSRLYDFRVDECTR